MVAAGSAHENAVKAGNSSEMEKCPAVGPVWPSEKPCGGTFPGSTPVGELPLYRSCRSEPRLRFCPEIRHAGVRRGLRRYDRHSSLNRYSRLVKELKGGGVFVDLGAYGGGTIGTKIFVLVPFRQDEEQLFPHGDGSLTLSAIQRRCLKFLEAGFLHIKNYKKKSLRSQPFIFMKSNV